MIRLVIDSNYMCYLSKFALSEGLWYRGGRTEIIFGVLKNILALAKRFETSDFVFCWDSKESKRKDIFKDYKYKRHQDKTEGELFGDQIAFRQFDILRVEVLPYLGFSNVFYQKGYEADDLIASAVMNNQDATNIVISSDNDLLQLLDYCCLYNFSKKETMTKGLFIRKYGILPNQWVSVKKLAGCNGDNVPGVAGVGEVKAIRYIKGEILHGKTFDAIHQRTIEEELLTEKLVKLPFPGTQVFELKENCFSEQKYKSVCDEFGFISLKDDDIWSKYFGR